jgi:hypothetical protein
MTYKLQIFFTPLVERSEKGERRLEKERDGIRTEISFLFEKLK